MTRVTIHWALVVAAAVAASGIPIASVAQETAQETELYYDVEDEDWREIASRVAAAEQGFDAIPAPIERATLPDLPAGGAGGTAPPGVAGTGISSEPLPEPNIAVPAEPTPPPPPTEPKVAAKPHSPLAAELLSGLRPTVVPKRKIVKATPESTLKQQLWRFYSERDGEPVWISNGSFSEAALAVVAEMSRAKDWGLDPSAFDVPVSVPAAASEKALVDVEMKFTKAVVDYATQAKTGRIDPIKISDLIDRMSVAPNAYEVLAAVTAGDAAKGLLTFHPKHPQFEKLRQAYLSLREGKAEPARVVVSEGPKLKPGAKHPNIALLRERLRVPEGVEGAEVYDSTLVDAVKAFQKENGLRIDGIVTKQLRQALNGDKTEPREKRMERILANMERWRWTPSDWGTSYVHNNIPEFMTRLYRNGQVTFTERIVVGKPVTPTSVFSDRFEYVDFNPRWNVPNSIKVNEIWPDMQRRGAAAALRGRGLKVDLGNGKVGEPDSINWSSVDIRGVGIFQPTGPTNALGRVKFMFPNKHDIYMHDTPSKALFNETTRAFSHGCMRVRNPETFAVALLGEANGASEHEVSLDLATDQNHQVILKKKIPIHVTYFTAWVGDDGVVSTKYDIYGHDRRTTLALAGKFNAFERQVPPKVEFEGPSGDLASSVLGNAERRRARVASQQGGAVSVFSIFDLFQPQPQVSSTTSPPTKPRRARSVNKQLQTQ